MDEMVYQQFKRHMIMPFAVLLNARSLQSGNLMELGEGTRTIFGQFKPSATYTISAKKLLLDDKDYSQP
jgi:hypothetical protein